MAKNTTMASMEKETATIIVNGETYTMVDYRKMLKAKAKKNSKKKKTAKKNYTEVTELASYLDKMLKKMDTLKSFAAYYDHAQRQWGTIGRDILQHRKIRPHFVMYRVHLREFETLVNDIKKMSKANEKAVFQFLEKATWKLDDINTNVKDIMKGARESGYLEAYKHHECINGKGKRLGLNTLIGKALRAMSEIEDNIKELGMMVNDGIDPLNYIESMSYKDRVKCFAR